MAACIPPIRRLYLIVFHIPGVEPFGGSSRQQKPYRRHTSPRDRPGKNRGPDTEPMSLDTGWYTAMPRGTDGDGEGLVELVHGMIRQTIETDMNSDSEKNSANVEEGRQRRSGRNWC